jgi:hypothetical protein
MTTRHKDCALVHFVDAHRAIGHEVHVDGKQAICLTCKAGLTLNTETWWRNNPANREEQ